MTSADVPIRNRVSRYVLGVGGGQHDFSACLLRDGAISVAVDAERVTREKHAMDLALWERRNDPIHREQLTEQGASSIRQALDYVLTAEGISMADVGAVYTAADYFPLDRGIEGSPFVSINHHLAHASSAFFASPFEEAAVLIVDGSGDAFELEGARLRESITYFVGRDRKIERLQRIGGRTLGIFYRWITQGLGFGLFEQGTTMALAPFGSPRFLTDMRQIVVLADGGVVRLTQQEREVRAWISEELRIAPDEDSRFKVAADIAFAAQVVVEEALIHCLHHLYAITGVKQLCLAGGVALNCSANGRILAETPFEELFIQPAAADDGIAIGACLYAWHQEWNEPRQTYQMKHAYLGKSYSRKEIEDSVVSCGSAVSSYVPPSVVSEAAARIASGQVVAWFQGGSEIGPRALGHRSILADPRRAEVKEILNLYVKKRQFFRPFAPSVLEEHAPSYFECSGSLPFMLLAVPVRESVKSTVPAIVHVDGSSRIQTVTKEANDRYYELLQAFYSLTGVPMILNTSFNLKGEPIVETPQDALDSFLRSKIDVLILGDLVIEQTK